MGETSRRSAILAASSRLFAEKGYGNTTTSEIAREAGVAEGTLYHHFGSKDDIFLTLFNETIDGYLGGAESTVREKETGRALLSSFIRFHFDYLQRHTEQFLIIVRDMPPHMADPGSGHAGARREKFDRLTALLTDILSRGDADGSLRLRFPPRDTAKMLRGVLYGTTRHRMLGFIDLPLPRLARMLEDFCLEALSPAREAKLAPQGGPRR